MPIPKPHGDAPPPPPPPDATQGTVKPLMILRLKPGITISESQRDRLLTVSEQVGKALNSGGGLILDGSIVEPLVLIYGGQVIRFDGYEEEDPEGMTGGYRPEPPPKPARRTQEDRETW